MGNYNTVGYGAPYLYDFSNSYNSVRTPSTMHVSDTGLQWYFRRYLLQKAISIFKWEMPEAWAKNYFLYVLYCWGYVAVINTDLFGVIPQGCSLSGYDVFYQPTTATIANPLLKGIVQPKIDKQCTLIRLQPDYGSIMDKVNFYADMLALCAETVGTNLFNSKLAYVFAAQDKTSAESLKKLYDRIASGEPAAVIDKNLFNEDGSPNWMMFNQHLKESYIAGDIMEDMRKWEIKFCTDLGIPNSNTEKKERLITDEVNSNNAETACLGELWLQTLNKEIKKANAMFDGLDMSVTWRVDPNPETEAKPAKGSDSV